MLHLFITSLGDGARVGTLFTRRIMLRIEVDTESSETAKTLRIMLYAQNWGRLPIP